MPAQLAGAAQGRAAALVVQHLHFRRLVQGLGDLVAFGQGPQAARQLAPRRGLGKAGKQATDLVEFKNPQSCFIHGAATSMPVEQLFPAAKHRLAQFDKGRGEL